MKKLIKTMRLFRRVYIAEGEITTLMLTQQGLEADVTRLAAAVQSLTSNVSTLLGIAQSGQVVGATDDSSLVAAITGLEALNTSVSAAVANLQNPPTPPAGTTTPAPTSTGNAAAPAVEVHAAAKAL